ncbi:hypothetical protein QQX13_12555 [Demequina sp. SYSU T00068]|uniref:hypothetical protein n=1 Tax=Demequina lignilytica TaxID=3051663 RepID=UPI00262224A9|nr:hypothetical protein [Demequina sp. SYSU T00068]MDN4491665.1 hypothetical protein [Demequina sp. SYSU T00068]
MLRHGTRNVLASVAGVAGLLAVLALGLGSGALLVVGLLCGAAAGLWALWEWREARAHGDEHERFALEHGWDHLDRGAPYSLRFSRFPFGAGSHQHQEHILRGTYGGMRCATFTHAFEDRVAGREERTTPQLFQVTLAELPVNLPWLEIVPENAWHHAAQALGGMDVEVESHAFNQRWRVRAADRRYAHDVVDPRMIERLLDFDVEGCSIRIEGGAVMLWQPGRDGVGSLARRLGAVTGIARRIPDHVLRSYTDQGLGRPDPTAPLSGPSWAVTPGALTSRRYTGVGVDADGDGIEDWEQRRDGDGGVDGASR